MTGHQINSLVGDLVAMAQAMERLPQVEAELATEKHQVLRMAQSIVTIEADLEQSRSYAASLEAKVREMEASRDDAEMRFLELDERAAKAVRFLGQVQGLAVQAEIELAPPAPQPEPIVSEVKPIDDGAYTDDPRLAVPTPDTSGYHPKQVDDPSLPPQGQSEADPTSHAETSTALPQSPVAEPDGASLPSWASPTPPEPKPQPYAGIRYIDSPEWVPLENWIAGGGTRESYYDGRPWMDPA